MHDYLFVSQRFSVFASPAEKSNKRISKFEDTEANKTDRTTCGLRPIPGAGHH